MRRIHESSFHIALQIYSQLRCIVCLYLVTTDEYVILPLVHAESTLYLSVSGCESNAITQETNETESEHEITADDDVADDSVDSISQQVSDVLDNTESETTKSNETPVSCEICGKMFRKNAYLRNHLFQHTGERPFKCWECGLAFTLQSNLNRHKRIHTGKRSYECSLCDKSFSRRDTLNRHTKVRHNDEKPFPCPQCG